MPGTDPLLSSAQLLLLQLVARGYSRHQVARLLESPPRAVEEIEREACIALGAPDVDEAVQRAIARGLILGAPGGGWKPRAAMQRHEIGIR